MVLRLEPENAKAHANIGLILYHTGQTDKALAHLKVAVRIDPANAYARNNLGGVLEGQGDFKGAAKCYSEALGMRPGYKNAYVNLSRILRRAGDPALTVRCYREVLRSDPENAGAHMNLAIALPRLKTISDAIKGFETALDLEPRLTAQAAYGIARAHARQANVDLAVKSLKRGVAAGFQDWDRLAADPDLENIRKTVYYREMIARKGEN